MSIQFAQPTRLASMVPFAAIATLATFYLMVVMLAKEEVSIDTKTRTVFPNVVMPPPVIETLKNQPPDRPTELDTPPPLVESNPEFDPTDGTIAVIPSPPKPGKAFGGGVGPITDGQLVVIAKVAPQYPGSAISRHIEGFVDVGFDVTATGATTNIRIIHADPSGVFERTVLNTVKKWKYRPRMENGEPKATTNLVERVSFELDN